MRVAGRNCFSFVLVKGLLSDSRAGSDGEAET